MYYMYHMGPYVLLMYGDKVNCNFTVIGNHFGKTNASHMEYRKGAEKLRRRNLACSLFVRGSSKDYTSRYLSLYP